MSPTVSIYSLDNKGKQCSVVVSIHIIIIAISIILSSCLAMSC